jgi:HAD superfamily hydrolase (TIGR01509 family)
MRTAGLPHALDEDYFYALGGTPTRRVAELFGERYGLQLDPDAVFHHKEAIFTELQSQVRLIEPVVAFARRMAATHPLAVASGGPRPVVQRSLEVAGLAALFRAVVTADDVVHCKPAPDMFLLAAKLLGVAPGRCLVFEDAELGIQAARSAGMQVVRVPSRR